MTEKWSWFDRKFNFDFPAGKMPDIIERLVGTADRIEKLTAGLSEETLNWQETEGTWSIKENIGHLTDLEPLWLGRVHDIVGGEEFMRVADLTNQPTFLANHNDRTVDVLIKAFRSEREKLLQMLERLEPTHWSKSALHPRLKTPMRTVDLCLFVADHDDYHLARMRHLSKASRSG